MADAAPPPSPARPAAAAAAAARPPPPAAARAAEPADPAAFQRTLARKSAADPRNQLVLQTIRSLSAAFVYPEPTNVETNRKLWDEYAKSWDNTAAGGEGTAGAAAAAAAAAAATTTTTTTTPTTTPPPATGASGGGAAAGGNDWLRTMAAHVGGRTLEHVGDEWSDEASLAQVLEEFVFPFLSPDCAACEIGSGGGRVACRVFDKVATLSCFDVSKEMLRRAKAALDARGARNAKFVFLSGGGPREIPPRFNATFDFVYSFDVFVHLDLHTIWPYFQAIQRMLKPGGRAFISTSNILAPLGWQRFAKQTKYSVGGFYFVSPDMVRKMADRAGFDVVQESSWETGSANVYYERDFLFVLASRRQRT